MKVTALQVRMWFQDLALGRYNLKSVSSFSYLATDLNDLNKISQEINKQILAGNKAYYANNKIMKSKLLSRNTK